MAVDHLCINKIHACTGTALDHLYCRNPLPELIKSYLLAGKVEGKSPKTLEIQVAILASFADFSKDEEEPLTANNIRLYLLSLQSRNLSPDTLLTYYQRLKAFLNWLVNEEHIEKNPMRNIKPPRLPKRIVRPFSEEDIRNLLLLCSGNRFLDLRNRAIILLFLDTGLRLSELAGIQLVDIDFDRETIPVMGKGAKERVVRIGKTTQKALIRYILKRNDEHECFWVTEERHPMTKSGIQIAVKRLCKRANITGCKLGPHTFRHTAAINYLRNGGGEFTLQIMLGHSTLAMTRKYASSFSTEDMIRVHRVASPVDNMKLK